jgi:hypothetical protein
MTTIVFIGAVGRSGTTLLERTASTSRRAIALGEVVHLWERSVRDGEPCGCGLPFGDCPFWTDVGLRAFGGWLQVDAERIIADRRTVDRNRYIPFLLAPRFAPRYFREAHARSVSILEQLYEGVRAATGQESPILIDSSKHPSYLYLLRSVRSLDIRLLHIVRDPRGVAYSWSKVVARPESGEAMERLGTARACLRWTSHNLLFQMAGAFGVPRVRLAYERFTADPNTLGSAIDEVLRSDVPGGLDLAVVDHTVRLGTDHTVSGNPMRFAEGTVTIRPDQQWRTAMPARTRRVVGALTTPLRQLWA